MEIPSMKIEDGKIVEETMTLDIVVNGKTEQIVLKKLSSGERSKITSACTKTRHLGGQAQVDINSAELESQLLCAAIVSAPFPHDLNGVKNLPSDVSDYIMTAWTEFTTPTDSKKD
jgi:hypothetical protein